MAEASGSGKVPAKVRPRVSCVHEHFDQVRVTHPTTGKTSDGSTCKHCKFTLSNRVSTNLKNHLKSKHPETYEDVQSKFISNFFNKKFMLIFRV